MNEENNNKKDKTTPEQFKKLAITEEKAASFIVTLTDFANWCTVNMYNLDVDECLSIYEDFIKSNEHIIQKINKVMHLPP